MKKCIAVLLGLVLIGCASTQHSSSPETPPMSARDGTTWDGKPMITFDCTPGNAHLCRQEAVKRCPGGHAVVSEQLNAVSEGRQFAGALVGGALFGGAVAGKGDLYRLIVQCT